MIKNKSSWAVLIYGAIILFAGYVGHVKGGSSVSFYMGTGFGIFLILSSVAMFFEIRLGALAALFLSGMLTAVFVIRYSITQKQTPALLAILSCAMLLFLIIRQFRWKR